MTKILVAYLTIDTLSIQADVMAVHLVDIEVKNQTKVTAIKVQAAVGTRTAHRIVCLWKILTKTVDMETRSLSCYLLVASGNLHWSGYFWDCSVLLLINRTFGSSLSVPHQVIMTKFGKFNLFNNVHHFPLYELCSIECIIPLLNDSLYYIHASLQQNYRWSR